jgi:PAS domain S-box-containing protein
VIFENTASPVRDDMGSITSCVEIVRNVTARKRAAMTLKGSEQKYRALIETTDTGYVILDRNGNVLDANREYIRLTGHGELDEIRGKNVTEWTSPHDMEKNARAVCGCLERGFVRNLVIDCSVRNGVLILGEINATVIEMASGVQILSLCRDISDRARAMQEKEKLQARLNQAQKMEAIGILAGGIAHDFNNILTALVGYASLLQMKMEINKEDPLNLYVDHILLASQKGKSLIQGLLTFTRQYPITLDVVCVNDVVRNTEDLLKRLITEDICIISNLTGDKTTIMADVTRIDQILFNLVTNARDAMPKGGTLSIQTNVVELEDEFIKAYRYGELGRYVHLSVTDTGMGMDDKTKEQIFDPFFTTKEVGKGTGLGLSTVYGIVEYHKGFIFVNSEPGMGATFNIYFPFADEAIQKPVLVSRNARGGREVILIAEDDRAVRWLVRDVLLEHGYKVVEAIDGADAIEQFEKAPKIDLLILDSVMPRKNGLEAYDAISALSPGIKVLFTSGYTRDVVLNKGIEDRQFDFIPKPIVPGALLEKIREVLDK